MTASVHAPQAVARVWPAVEKPYAVLLLPSVVEGVPQKQELLLPLTLAYLLSAHIAFRFPLCERALAAVERVFDEILSGLPKESKGIRYESIKRPERASALVPFSSLLLTDDRGLQELTNCDGLPLAVISKSGGNGNLVRVQNLEKVADLGLRGKLACCAQLVNAQADGFVTGGHFSWSW